MCESWGLAAAAVASVRHHVALQAETAEPLLLPPALPPARRGLVALSAIVHRLMTTPDDAEAIDAVATALAPQADLDPELVLRSVRQVHSQLEEAAAHGRD